MVLSFLSKPFRAALSFMPGTTMLGARRDTPAFYKCRPENVCPSEEAEGPKMYAYLKEIDAEIMDLERLISSKNRTIIANLKKGTDTLDDEKQVIILTKALELKKADRRKLMSELGVKVGAALA
jgi:hypothetical protein